MEERRVEGNIYLTPCVGKQRPAFSFLWHLYTPDDSAKSNQCAAASSGSNLLRHQGKVDGSLHTAKIRR